MLTIQLLLTAALATAAPFSAQSLDGSQVEGELKSLADGQAVIEAATGPVTVPINKLAGLRTKSPTPARMQPLSVYVELVDGSTLSGDSYLVKSGSVELTHEPSHLLELPAKLVRSVRFMSFDEPALDKQWADLAATKATGDLLVVRKGSALDSLEGVVRDLDETTCQFELDGEVIPVKREKVVGLVYAQPEYRELAEPLGSLTTAETWNLQLKSVVLDGDKFTLETPAGMTLELPVESVWGFDFSAGKIAYLSDLEPESVQWTPLVGFAEPSEGLLGAFRYRRDLGFDQMPLKLDGQEFRKGLALASRTELIYKLPGKFRQFRTTVGIDDSTRETGSVWLAIKADGKTLWEGEVSGKQPSQPLELDIAGARRLEILADYGEGRDIGDRLDLGDAHVTK